MSQRVNDGEERRKIMVKAVKSEGELDEQEGADRHRGQMSTGSRRESVQRREQKIRQHRKKERKKQ